MKTGRAGPSGSILQRVSNENAEMARRKRRLSPPPGLEDPVSRAQAAELLGFPSVFRVRELEREGRLTVTRGVMGSAWYPRRQILLLREQEGRPALAGAPAVAQPGSPTGRRTDAELIAYLRRGTRQGHLGADSGAPTLVDLVADTGVSIARAQKVYRFWLAHDVHPAAQQARAGGRPLAAARSAPDDSRAPPTLAGAAAAGAPTAGPMPALAGAAAAAAPTAGPRGPAAAPGGIGAGARSERRSPTRLTRAALIRQLRAADPAVRAAAFSALKNTRPPADVP